MFNDSQLHDLAERLDQTLCGFGRSQPARLRELSGLRWRLAARLELLRRGTGLVEAMDEEVLRAIAAGQLDVGTRARYVAFRLDEADGAAPSVARQASAAPEVPPRLAAPPAVLAQIGPVIAEIAQRQLGLATLTTRNRDSLDFHEHAVWSIEAALTDAFIAGWHCSA
jgi:hypothetical protein